MRIPLSTFLALIACTPLIASCALFPRPPVQAPPPRLALPAAAEAPCELPTLRPNPTLADLEAAYIARGVALVNCQAAKDLSNQTLQAERALQDRWREEQQPRSVWPF